MSRISIPYMHEAVDIVNQLGRTRLARVQRFEVSANFPNTPVSELGSDRRVGRIFDIPEVSVTLSSMDVGARTAFHIAGVDFTAAPSGTRVASAISTMSALCSRSKRRLETMSCARSWCLEQKSKASRSTIRRTAMQPKISLSTERLVIICAMTLFWSVEP